MQVWSVIETKALNFWARNDPGSCRRSKFRLCLNFNRRSFPVKCQFTQFNYSNQTHSGNHFLLIIFNSNVGKKGCYDKYNKLPSNIYFQIFSVWFRQGDASIICCWSCWLFRFYLKLAWIYNKVGESEAKKYLRT